MPIVNVDKDYKYDVAFSFLQADESLAYEISDAIQDRYESFIYSEQQKELIGKDGTETFRQVFQDESRIVVILYRESWGSTFWTRVEENSIKNRAFEESADFTIFISLDGKKPNWLSSNQIWYDFERFGIKPTAAIIEKRISEYGGAKREETVIDQAARHKREALRRKEMEEYATSKQGLEDGLNEIEELLHLAESNITEISDHTVGLNFGKRTTDKIEFTTFGRKIGLTFYWHRKYIDSLVSSYLEVYIATGDYYDIHPRKPGKVLKKELYLFYKNSADTKGWVVQENKSGFITTSSLVNQWQKDFLSRDQIDRKEDDNLRSRY
jgi:hypothetical protein